MCVTNLDDKKSKEKHWISILIDRNTAVYFDSFGTEYISQVEVNKIKDKSITNNIFRIKVNESIMCRSYSIAFIEYILAGKTFLDYTNLFSLNDNKSNDKVIYMYFKDRYVKSCV